MNGLDRLCNHNCLFCIEKIELDHNSEVLPTLDDVKNEIDKYYSIYKSIDCIYIAGGEPTLNPQFEDIIKYLKSICSNMVLSTNCDYENPDKIIHVLEEYNINSISTSIHGSNSISHDGLTLSNGSFGRTVNTITQMIEKGFSVSINSVICSKNILDMPMILNLFSSIPIKKLVFTHYAHHGNAYYHKDLFFDVDKYGYIISQTIDSLNEVNFEVKFRDFPICLDTRLLNLQENVTDIHIAQKKENEYVFISEKAPFIEKPKCINCTFYSACPKYLKSNYCEVL